MLTAINKDIKSVQDYLKIYVHAFFSHVVPNTTLVKCLLCGKSYE